MNSAGILLAENWLDKMLEFSDPDDGSCGQLDILTETATVGPSSSVASSQLPIGTSDLGSNKNTIKLNYLPSSSIKSEKINFSETQCINSFNPNGTNPNVINDDITNLQPLVVSNLKSAKKSIILTQTTRNKEKPQVIKATLELMPSKPKDPDYFIYKDCITTKSNKTISFKVKGPADQIESYFQYRTLTKKKTPVIKCKGCFCKICTDPIHDIGFMHCIHSEGRNDYFKSEDKLTIYTEVPQTNSKSVNEFEFVLNIICRNSCKNHATNGKDMNLVINLRNRSSGIIEPYTFSVQIRENPKRDHADHVYRILNIKIPSLLGVKRVSIDLPLGTSIKKSKSLTVDSTFDEDNIDFDEPSVHFFEEPSSLLQECVHNSVKAEFGCLLSASSTTDEQLCEQVAQEAATTVPAKLAFVVEDLPCGETTNHIMGLIQSLGGKTTEIPSGFIENIMIFNDLTNS